MTERLSAGLIPAIFKLFGCSQTIPKQVLMILQEQYSIGYINCLLFLQKHKNTAKFQKQI